jgi:hypothetical protein
MIAHLAAYLLAAVVTYPVMQVVDDSGAVVSGATVTIASVTDKAGTAIASPGATVNLAGPNVSIDYDAAAKGEAWVTLAVSKVGSTFTGANAAPAFYLAADSSRILTALPSSGVLLVKPAVTLAAADVSGSLPAADSPGMATLLTRIVATVPSLSQIVAGVGGGGGGSAPSGVVVMTGRIVSADSATSFTADLSENAPGNPLAYVNRQILFQVGDADQEKGVILAAVVTGTKGAYRVTFTMNPSPARGLPALQTKPNPDDTFKLF